MEHTAKQLITLTVGTLLILVSTANARAQGTVEGRVEDPSGAPLPGVNIRLLSTSLGAVSDAEGRYEIPGIPAGAYRIRASLIGYAARTRRITVADGQTLDLRFTLEEWPIELSDIIVSASAIDEEIAKAPNRVNILAREEIEHTPARNIQEVMQYTEGLFISRGEGINMTFPRIVIRGMNTGFLGRNTAALVLLNGHPLNGSLGSWGSVGDLDALPIDLIQKTEIIKGPYTSTYGSGATGGVINVLTRKHFSRPAGGSITLKTGAYGFRSVSPIVSGQVHNLSYAVWGEFLHGAERETRRRSTWDTEQNGYLAKGRTEHTKYGFLLGYDLSDTDRIDVLANHFERINNYNGRPISSEETNGELLHITFTRAIGDRFKLQVLGNYTDTEYDGPADATPVHPDSSDRITKFQQWPNRELGLKAVFSGSPDPAHSLTTGIEWRRNRSGRTTYWGDREQLEFDIRGTQDIYSFFLEDKIHLQKVELTPSLRLEQWKDHALYSRQAADAARGGQVHIGYASGRTDNKTFSPKLGLAVLVSDGLKLRASAGSTFRAPRITETYSPTYTTLPHLQYRSNLDLEEENVISYEAGFDFHAQDGRFLLSLTGFYVDARNRIDFTFTGGFTPEDPFIIMHRNLDARIPGIEGEIGFRPVHELSLGANFTATSPEYHNAPGEFGNNTTPGVPNYTLNAHADLRPQDGLNLRLSYQHVGRIYDNPTNTIRLDPYSLFNAKARYDLRVDDANTYYFDIALTNLLDEDYHIPSSAVWDYQPLGRALHVAVGYAF